MRNLVLIKRDSLRPRAGRNLRDHWDSLETHETIKDMGYRTNMFPYGSQRRRVAQRVGLIYNDDGTWSLAHLMNVRGHHKTWRERGAISPKKNMRE